MIYVNIILNLNYSFDIDFKIERNIFFHLLFVKLLPKKLFCKLIKNFLICRYQKLCFIKFQSENFDIKYDIFAKYFEWWNLLIRNQIILRIVFLPKKIRIVLNHDENYEDCLKDNWKDNRNKFLFIIKNSLFIYLKKIMCKNESLSILT